MKKILLSLAVIATGFSAQSQVICAGISPASIAGNYDFTWADPAGGDWTTPDFLIAGTFVEDTLAIVDDGSTGTNTQGNPVSAEGCFPLINGVDVSGKIAVATASSAMDPPFATAFWRLAMASLNVGLLKIFCVSSRAFVKGTWFCNN